MMKPVRDSSASSVLQLMTPHLRSAAVKFASNEWVLQIVWAYIDPHLPWLRLHHRPLESLVECVVQWLLPEA